MERVDEAVEKGSSAFYAPGVNFWYLYRKVCSLHSAESPGSQVHVFAISRGLAHRSFTFRKIIVVIAFVHRIAHHSLFRGCSCVDARLNTRETTSVHASFSIV